MGARELTGFPDLYAASGAHPMIRCEVPADRPVEALVLGEAVAFARPSHVRGLVVTLLGPAPDVARLLADPALPRLVFGLRKVGMISVPATNLADLEGRFGTRTGGDWEWMVTTDPPPTMPAEDRLVRFAERDRADLDAFLARHNPRTDGRPFARAGQVWLGARDDDGRILACGGAEPTDAGVGELVGITVHSDARGRGWGAAVTAALTREAVDRDGICCLGMYADNARARGVYHRLGYATAVAFSSRVVTLPRSVASTR
ncbi:MAG: GNAT family N-acetyltransferase [Dermatophilaceae bacterium]